LYGITESLWMDEKATLYAAGNWLYEFRKGKWGYVQSMPENFLNGNAGYKYRGYIHSIRGTASNDIFVFGEINTIPHFNGLTWSEVGLPYNPLNFNMFWYKGAIKGNLVVGVGKCDGKAILIRMNR
jgi:hypothetical protein